ncbi:MAG: type IX secretion system membrane protein PorP/SprF, partial [Bacteroidales bacterium]|nr:type IX secretion system membrane protein PorP/SprF [Bacteroidales bacterium]
MKTIYRIIAIVIILVITSKIKAQDPNFTQLVNHPILLNPALISSNNDFRLTLAHRAQWQSIEQGYQTESFSIIYPLFLKKESWRNDRGNAKLDIGFNVTNDRAGAY